jgi:hypothetical protein
MSEKLAGFIYFTYMSTANILENYLLILSFIEVLKRDVIIKKICGNTIPKLKGEKMN